MDPDPDPGIHIWEKWIRILGSTFGKSGSGSKVDPDPRKEIEVDPDPDQDPERGLKWIRIRPNAVDPGGSGSETLIYRHLILTACYSQQMDCL